jgi:hypothetical protein
MTANKQTSKAASFSALALALFIACSCLSGMRPQPALAKDDLPPNTAEVYRHHAIELLFKHKDDGNGFEWYQKAIELANKDYGPNSSYLGDLYFELGSAEKEAGHFKQAEQHYEASLKCKPNSVNTRLQLAYLYKKEKRTKDLYNQIQAIKTKDPGSTQVQQALLSLYSQENKRPDQAAQSALVVHQMAIAKTQAIASAKSAGWLNPFTTSTAAVTKSPTAAPSEQTASAAIKLTTPEASSPIVTPVETRPATNENPTAINKENSVNPLGVFSKMLAPHVKAPDKVDAGPKVQREQPAERDRNRLHLERERQREDLARRQAAQAQRAATRRGAAPSIAIARPAQSKLPGPALKTSAKKLTGKSAEGKAAEGKAVEAKAAMEAKPLEAKPAPTKVVETKPPAEAAPSKETTQEAVAPAETPAPAPKKKPNAFNKVNIFGKAGETEKTPDSNSENQPKSKPKPPPAPSSNIQRAMESVPMQPQMPIQEAPSPKRQGRPRPGLVPPPPPVMALPGMMNPNPYYGGGYPPPMIPQQMMNTAPPPRPKSKPVVKKEAPPEDEPAAAPASAKNSDDENFLIDWGGSKQKKKKAKPLE